MNKPVAIVVGGGNQHVEAINLLKNYGYYVVLVDYLKNPPAAYYADCHVQENAFDKDVLLSIARDMQCKAIVNLCYDLAMPAVAFVAEQLNIPFPFTYAQSLLYTNKRLMKLVFVKANIPTAKYCEVGVDSMPPADLHYPIVVKPADSSGSRGITKINDILEYEDAVNEACNNSASQTAILEEFLDGEEFQADCYSREGKACVVMVRKKLKFTVSDVVSPAGSLVYPPSAIDYTKFEILAQKLVDAFNINNCTFFFQCINTADTLSMIELGVRMGGGLSYRMIKWITDFDYLKATLDSQLLYQLPDVYHTPSCYYLTNAIFAEKSTVNKIEGFDSLCDDPYFDFYDNYVVSDREVDGIITNKNRLAFYMIHAETKDVLCDCMMKVVQSIKVLDSNGENRILREPYSFLAKRLIEE